MDESESKTSSNIVEELHDFWRIHALYCFLDGPFLQTKAEELD
jgi:hypothetical protein